jgi:hypothetical protein
MEYKLEESILRTLTTDIFPLQRCRLVSLEVELTVRKKDNDSTSMLRVVREGSTSLYVTHIERLALN